MSNSRITESDVLDHLPYAEVVQLRNELSRLRTDFDTLVDSSPDLAVRFDSTGRCIYSSAYGERITGIPTAMLLGKRLDEVDGLSDKDVASWQDALTSVFSSKHPLYIDLASLSAGPRRRTFACILVGKMGAADEAETVSIVARDLEFYARADRDTFINKIAQAVLWSASPAELQSTALALIGERLDADRCFYVLYDVSRNVARIEKDWCREGVSSLEGDWELTGWGTGIKDIYPKRRTVVIEDVATSNLTPGVIELFLETGQRSYIAVPFFERTGEVVAALTVMMASTARTWSREEIDLVEAAAVQVRSAVEAARGRERDRESLIRQRAFVADVLLSVTGGRLCLCYSSKDLPQPLSQVGDSIPLYEFEGIRELRERVKEVATHAEFANERWQDLISAVSEAAMNAVVHAGGGQARICRDGDNIQVWVEDQGKGIAMADLPRATLEKGYSTAGTLGHGMKVMLSTSDRIWMYTSSSGTTLVIEQSRIPSEHDWMREITEY